MVYKMEESIFTDISLDRNVLILSVDDEHPCLLNYIRRIAAEEIRGKVLQLTKMTETVRIAYKTEQFEKMLKLTYIDQEKLVGKDAITFKVNVSSGDEYRMVTSADIMFFEDGKPCAIKKIVRDDIYYLTLAPGTTLYLEGNVAVERIKPFGTFAIAPHFDESRYVGKSEVSVIEYMSPYAFLINVLNRAIALLKEFNLLDEIVERASMDIDVRMRYYRCANFSTLNPIADLVARHEKDMLVSYTESYRVQKEPVFMLSASPDRVYPYRDLLVDRLVATRSFVEKNKKLLSRLVTDY